MAEQNRAEQIIVLSCRIHTTFLFFILVAIFVRDDGNALVSAKLDSLSSSLCVYCLSGIFFAFHFLAVCCRIGDPPLPSLFLFRMICSM